MKLHFFNPENDLALADGGFSYCPPPAAMRIANDLASLPLWYAGKDDAVLLPAAHLQYRDSMAALFNLPAASSTPPLPAVTQLTPWGWSAQMRHRFKAMGFDKALLPTDGQITRMRKLSSRVLTIDILAALRDAGVDTPPLPRYIDNLDDAVAFVEGCERCVVKAPWSGSGKGIMWGIGRAEEPMVHFCKGVIRRQGGVLCEHFLNAKAEFAMEFCADGCGVQFVGYSLFTAENGAYTGNLLAADSAIETHLSKFIDVEQLANVREHLCEIMQRLLVDSGYCGYFGVDMMLYDNGDGCRLNPCMEVNLRMNMGVVARRFYDGFVKPGRSGIYRVKYYKGAGDALRFHLEQQAAYPLNVDDGRIIGGYMNLSPVTYDSRYVAYTIIGDGC